MSKCFLFKKEIVVVYIYPTNAGSKWDDYAARFARLYKKFMPTIDHRLIVVANGGPPSRKALETMAPLKPDWIHYNNEGWDIGAYQHVARTVPADLMVCLGASTYFRKAGWLERMVEAARKKGLGFYGAMGNKGDYRKKIWPHLRTTGFWFDPVLLNAYPVSVKKKSQRYEFEHGQTCLFEWAKTFGIPVWVVTYDGEYEIPHIHRIKNGYQTGDQSNLLTGDRLTEPPYYHRK